MTNLLDHLDMFREFYPINDPKFDELLQRDIVNFRITTSMIPYLLGIDSYEKNLMGTVENNPIFFPSRDSDCCRSPPRDAPKNTIQVRFTKRPEAMERHGTPFRKKSEPMKNLLLSSPVNKPPPTNTQYEGKVKVNTTNCQIVIIDGQHRAMSLLALHRNLANG